MSSLCPFVPVCPPFMVPFVAPLPFCPPTVEPFAPFAPNAAAKPIELLLRQNVPLFLFSTVGYALAGLGVGDLACSSPMSPTALGVDGLSSVSSPARKLIAKELFLFQKLPLFFLFQLGELETELRPADDSGRDGASGDVLS